MATDVEMVQGIRETLAKYRSSVKDEADRQLLDATICMMDEHLMLLESDE
jgi:hypothetical protein